MLILFFSVAGLLLVYLVAAIPGVTLVWWLRRHPRFSRRVKLFASTLLISLFIAPAFTLVSGYVPVVIPFAFAVLVDDRSFPNNLFLWNVLVGATIVQNKKWR